MKLFARWKKREQEPPESLREISETVQEIPEEPQEPPAEQTAGPLRLLSYQAANLQGIGARSRQEDSFAFVNVLDVTMMREKGLFAIVADGMGGMKDGKLASETAIAEIKAGFQQINYEGDLAVQLNKFVLRAGSRVFQALEGDGGSTVVVCLFYQEKLYFTSVGDSFLYLKRNNQLCRLNLEHNILHQSYREHIRNGGLNPVLSQREPEKAALTRFLGMETLEDVDFLRRPLPLQSGDTLLLCSDGVGGVLAEQSLLDCLNQLTPQEMCTAMERGILREHRQHQDNYTALVIQCEY